MHHKKLGLAATLALTLTAPMTMAAEGDQPLKFYGQAHVSVDFLDDSDESPARPE